MRIFKNYLIFFEIELIEKTFLKFKFEIIPIEKTININHNNEIIISKLKKSIKKWVSFICSKNNS